MALEERFSQLSCHFDAELVLCSILDLNTTQGGTIDIPELVAAFLTSFDTERGRLVLIRSALFCGNAAMFTTVLQDVLRCTPTSSRFRAEVCKVVTTQGFDQDRHSAAASAESIALVQHACLQVLVAGIPPLLSSFKHMCSFVTNVPCVWVARFFDASGNSGRLTLAFAAHLCFGCLPVMAQLRQGSICEENAESDDAEWSGVFRGVGVHENVALLERLFIKYLKVADRERCVVTRAAFMVSAATLWQRIGRIKITRAILVLAFDSTTCRVKFVSSAHYKHGVAAEADEKGLHVSATTSSSLSSSSCALEALEAALLAFALTRSLASPEAAFPTLNCARRLQSLAAACAPENIFAHFVESAGVPFGFDLALFWARAGKQALLAHLFLKTALLHDPATVAALKSAYFAMPVSETKLLLFRYMQPLLQTADILKSDGDGESASALKKTKI